MAYNNYQSFKSDLFNPKKNKEAVFYRLKHNYTFPEQVKTIRQIPKTFHSWLYGRTLFKDEGDFGSQAMQYIADAAKQLNWDCHLFFHYSTQINDFLSLKTDFENHFLKGEYADARACMEKVQQNICASYWGMENQFLLIQYEKGLEYNFKLLNECKAKSLKDGAYFMYAHFFSYKVEEDISFFSYESNLNSYVKYFGDAHKNFFNYRFNPIEYTYENIAEVLTISTKTSLIDRYMVFRDMLAHLLTEPDYQQQLLVWCRHLVVSIHDPLLIKIISFLEGTLSPEVKSKSITALRIIDLYTEAQYEATINAASTYLNTEVVDLGILEIYIKAHIFLGKPVAPVCEGSCMLNKIVTMMTDFLDKGSRTTEAFVDLLTLSNAISSFDIAKSTPAFLKLDLNESDHIDPKKGYVFSQIFNPAHYKLFPSTDQKLNYLDALSVAGASITVAFFKDLVNVSRELGDNKNIPGYRIKFYKAQIFMDLREYEIAKNLLESIITEHDRVGFFQEAITHQLFHCYAQIGDIDRAISLYVEQFLKNDELTSRIDGKPLANQVVGAKFKNVTHDNIDLPIFIFLAQEEAHAKFIAYDVYMRAIGNERPTQIVVNSAPSQQLVYFLKQVATPKVISKKVLIFKNSAEVLKERIAICQTLFKVDPSSAAEYSREISEHTQRLIVQQRIKEIDQSMIYVDESGIISHELGEINKNFNRFRNISELLSLNKTDATGINIEALYSLVLGKIDTDAYKRSVRKTNIHFQVFEQLFLEIRDKFLFSNHYGLDYYLSQRIRHGTIIGQLRKHFQQHGLVTSKDTSDGAYLPNRLWLGKLELEEEAAVLFSDRMAAFSTSVDKLILDLKDKSIQIRTEDPKTNQAGWFNYSYIPEWDSDELRRFFLAKIQFETDFHEFVTMIFEVLWLQTMKLLEAIRHKIESTVKVNFISVLDDLEIDLVNIPGTDNHAKSIFKSIADCRTSVQEDVDAVVRWFNKSKSDEVEFTLADVFNTSLTIVNNINSPFTINFDERLDETTLFKGHNFSHFVDLLKIFITNIFNYYRDHNLLSLPGQATFHITDDILTITFISNLAEDEDIAALQLKIDGIRNDLNKANYKAIRGEGNTGFSKANNIVKNVFRNASNEIKLELIDGRFETHCQINIKNLIV